MKIQVREYSRHHFLIILLHFTVTMITLLFRLFASVVSEWWRYNIIIYISHLLATLCSISSAVWNWAWGKYLYHGNWQKLQIKPPFSPLENQLLNL